MTTFAEIIDAADRLSIDEQQAMVEILRRRIAEKNRALLAKEIAQARAEFASGAASAATVGQIMDEAFGEP